MAHEFESGVTIGKVSWHGLEHNQKEEIKTVREMLILAGLDWLVEMKPLYRQLDDGQLIESKLSRAVVRMSDGSELGNVGPEWTPVQNTDAFEPLQPLIDSGYLKLATAGSLKGGAKVYMSGKIAGETADVFPGDPVEGYFLAYQGFDGKLKLVYKHTPTRVVCANTLGVACFGDSGRKDYQKEGVFFSHTSNVNKRVEALKDHFKVMASDFAKSIEAYKVMGSKQINPLKFFETLLGIEERRLAAEKAGEEASTKNMRVLTRLMESYESQPGAQFGAGTGWQAYNAVTYFVDHQRGREGNRLDSSWFGVGAALKKEALNLALAYA